MTESLEQFMQRTRPHFEAQLRRFLAAQRAAVDNTQALQELHNALEYSCLQGGKRLRAMLVYLGAQACGASLATQHSEPVSVDIAAIAIELVHCYSLVHDDLPAMDDDALRRGQPSCHIQFGEPNAILAGDALQALAFQCLAEADIDPAIRVALLQRLARAAGAQGMVGGQAIDLAAVNRELSLAQLQAMHRLKTGALFECAANLGAVCAAADQTQQQALQHYARALGLAFQIQDDIIDVQGDPSVTGKAQGADIAANKPTFPALLGVQGAIDYAQQTCSEALAALQGFDHRAEPLRQLAQYVIARPY